jgi:hypothetical protein
VSRQRNADLPGPKQEEWDEEKQALRANSARLAARVKVLEEALRDIAQAKCHCDGYCGPCGCGERMRDVAEDALAAKEEA